MQNAKNDNPDLRTLIAMSKLPAGERPDPGTRAYLDKGTPGTDPGMLPLFDDAPLVATDADDHDLTQRSYALAS